MIAPVASAHAAEGATGPNADLLTGVAMICAGCGYRADPEAPYPVHCPQHVAGDDVDHLMTRRIDPTRARFAVDDHPDPYVRHREMLRAWHLATAAGWSDERFVDLVGDLERRIAGVDGRGFAVTPFVRADALSDRLGFAVSGGVWTKDETANVSGSHKGRHLLGALLELLVEEALGRCPPERPLAIASCGNAALAAGVLAAAVDRRLLVFVPTDADPAVLVRLEALGAAVTVCRRRRGEHGDPTVSAMRAALAAGAIPFTCQGPDNGLAIEGGLTLAWEIAAAVAKDRGRLDRIVVQVGGGALASACVQGFEEAVRWGVLPAMPRIDTVQTCGAWPLYRSWRLAIERLAELGVTVSPGRPVGLTDPGLERALADLAAHRSAFMWPWETTPHSVAHGILDDETYDWLAVLRGMLATGGRPVVVDEPTLIEANALAHAATGIAADETGTSGLAGLLDLRRLGEVDRGERVAVLFTGVRRSPPPNPPSRPIEGSA